MVLDFISFAKARQARIKAGWIRNLSSSRSNLFDKKLILRKARKWLVLLTLMSNEHKNDDQNRGSTDKNVSSVAMSFNLRNEWTISDRLITWKWSGLRMCPHDFLPPNFLFRFNNWRCRHRKFAVMSIWKLNGIYVQLPRIWWFSVGALLICIRHCPTIWWRYLLLKIYWDLTM